MGTDSSHLTLKLGTLIGFLLLWQVSIGYFQVVPSYLMPAPTEIVGTLIDLLGTENFQFHIRETIRRIVTASIISIVVGVSLGLSIGWSRRVELAVFPLVSAIYPVPIVALLPLLLLFFSNNEHAYLLLISVAGTFTILFHAKNGIDGINNIYFYVAEDYGVNSRYRYFREILLPGAIPSVYTGIRLGLNTILLVTIAVEFIDTNHGLGSFIWTAWGTLQTERMYAAIVIVLFLGIVITYGLSWIGGRMIPWKADLGES